MRLVIFVLMTAYTINRLADWRREIDVICTRLIKERQVLLILITCVSFMVWSIIRLKRQRWWVY